MLQYEMYNWGDSSQGCLLYSPSLTKSDPDDCFEKLPIKAEGFDAKFDIKTFQMLKNHSSIIYDWEGRLYSYGYGYYGQLGHGAAYDHDDLSVFEPKRIEALVSENIVEVSSSPEEEEAHTLFRNENGGVFGCGDNDDWQALGRALDKGDRVLIPKAIALAEEVCAMACGYCFSGVVNEAQTTIYCFGGNYVGELGAGVDYEVCPLRGPGAVIGAIQEEWKVLALCMGYGFCMALTITAEEFPRKKKCWSWGDNESGTAGIGTYGSDYFSTAFVMEYFEKNNIEVEKITCGPYHNAVVSADGVLYMWGSNTKGKCGVGSTASCITVPTIVHFALNVEPGFKVTCLKVCCAKDHNLAICEYRESRHAQKICYSWGETILGRLGHGMDHADVDCVNEPLEIFFFKDLEDDCTIVDIGVGGCSSHCLVEKTYSHLNDVFLQDDKIELLKALDII